jgi:hypothetical protein
MTLRRAPLENSMKAYCTILLLTGTSSAFGHEHGVISQASDLVPWCKAEAEARYARNITPYNWTASYHQKGNVLYVDGNLRANGEEVTVHCRIAGGARDEYATIDIDESNPSLRSGAIRCT